MYDVEDLVAEELNEAERTVDYFGMLELLKNHYGDGSVYLPEGASLTLVMLAKQQGYLNDEYYLTRKGRKFVTEHRLQKNRF